MIGININAIIPNNSHLKLSPKDTYLLNGANKPLITPAETITNKDVNTVKTVTNTSP
jgi:hypothetical protein